MKILNSHAGATLAHPLYSVLVLLHSYEHFLSFFDTFHTSVTATKLSIPALGLTGPGQIGLLSCI